MITIFPSLATKLLQDCFFSFSTANFKMEIEPRDPGTQIELDSYVLS